ncbi:disease resistance protein At4g27190-like isoform X2 [Tasmannia lanceolata]|uniref:disease resistance protein At4g27190-like isoform X2 n=1 Tax=Tasmannia lanceolata TaxID=3420 RepID=UPI004064BF31
MESQAVIKVEVLSDEDSWILFREKAGDVLDCTEQQIVARKVAKECGGLPIAIVTVGRALRDQDQLVWKDALLQLKRSIATLIEGIHQKVFSSLRLSYNSLPSEQIKLCFLFCCIFQEDHNISVKLLMKYAIGEIFLCDLPTLEETRYTVYNFVRTLKDSCLPSDGDNGGWVKMHGIIRNMGILIASNDVHWFLVKAGMGEAEWPTAKRLGKCYRISFMSTDINWLPDQPNCPRLKTLLMQNNWYLKEIPANFFRRMPNLHVLNLSYTHISSLPPSLVRLKNLQTLRLDMCIHLTDVSLIRELPNLKVLSPRSSGIRELPFELHTLKLLDLLNTIYLKKIVAMAEGEEQVVDKKGSLFKLRSLSIENLPNLTSFCQDGVLLDWPSLLLSKAEETSSEDSKCVQTRNDRRGK